MATISVVERTGPICGSPDDGERLCDEIRALLQRGEPVCLDFTGVTVVMPPFVTDAIGPLYGEFDKEFLATHLTWTGLNELYDRGVKRVRDKAIFFYAQSPEIQARLVEADLTRIERMGLFIPPSLVRAAVVDITRPNQSVPAQVVVDANVCYFVGYSNFSQLSAAGGRAPQAYQLREYRLWRTHALQHGCLFFADVVTLAELVRLLEYAELEALWLTDPSTPPGSRFDSSQCKQARYDYSAYLALIRKTVLDDLANLRVTVRPLSPFPTPTDTIDQTNAAWQSSAGDYADAVMVASAKHNGILHILSDDIDLLTFDGVTLYTANATAIQAARTAGKLLP